MTNQQGAPEALQIAIALEREWQADALNYDTALSAAAELRRLHELTESQQEIIGKVADSLLDAHITAQAIRPAVGKALVSQLLEALETSRVLKADFESLESYGIENRKRAAAIEAARAYISTDLAALVEAQQRANHVQNPAEIEHVAGDVSKNGAEVNMSPQQEEQEPCPTCAALARTVMLDQVSFDRKPDCYGIRQITDDEGVEEWEDIRTSPDVAREEANDMMATGRGEIYEVVPLWTTPLPSPTPQADSAKDEPLQAFDSPRAKALMRAWEEGWAACRDAEYVGEEAQNDAFNSSNTLTLCIAEDQQLPAPQADSQPAPVEVADAMADSQYLAGVSAGWNAANADDPNAALQKLHESRAGYLKPLSAARAPSDSVTAPAGGAVAGPGWQMVPVKPTPEMLRAGDQKTWVLPALDCWRAMLAAAPAPLAHAADSVPEDAAPQAMLSPQVPVSEDTLRWWRELTTVNPQDLAPRIDAYLDAARKQGGKP